MKAIIIYNPTSGKEIFKKYIDTVLKKLSAKYEVDVYATTCQGDATIKAREIASKYDLVIASGGDGTLHEVVSGIADCEIRPAIGYIPTGTVNDFANTMGIPTDILKATDIILQSEPSAIDIGKINDTYFLYVTAFGAFTKVSYSTPSKLKTYFGPLAYFFKAITEIKHIRSHYIELEANNYIVNGDYYVGLFVNSKSIAGFKNVIPNAKLNDGFFDVLLIPKTRRIIAHEIINGFLNGFRENYTSRDIVHIKTDRLTMNSKRNTKFNIDGELGLQTKEVQVECLKQYIRFHVPNAMKDKILL